MVASSCGPRPALTSRGRGAFRPAGHALLARPGAPGLLGRSRFCPRLHAPAAGLGRAGRAPCASGCRKMVASAGAEAGALLSQGSPRRWPSATAGPSGVESASEDDEPGEEVRRLAGSGRPGAGRAGPAGKRAGPCREGAPGRAACCARRLPGSGPRTPGARFPQAGRGPGARGRCVTRETGRGRAGAPAGVSGSWWGGSAPRAVKVRRRWRGAGQEARLA